MKFSNLLMAKITILSLFAITILTLPSCRQASEDLTEEIIKANENFISSFNSNDAAALADVYTSDASLLPPNSDIITGTEAIKAFWQGVFDAGITRGELETLSAWGSGNNAVEEGRFKIYAGDLMVDHGKYIVLWKKVDGTWKYHKDMWSSSVPIPDNVGVVQSMYDAFAKGDVPGVLAGLDEQIVWNEAENFPYADGNPYVGHNAVVNGVFARIGAEWEYWKLEDMSLSETGSDKVFATGRYNAKHKRTGKSINAQFVHVWTLKDGKAIQFQQYADTKQAAAAVR